VQYSALEIEGETIV